MSLLLESYAAGRWYRAAGAVYRLPAPSSALTERTAEIAAAIRGDRCSPSRTMRTLYRMVSMPAIGSRATGAGVPAGVSSGETPAGVASADEIAAVDGADILAFGANDFTAELGVPGRYDDPRVTAAIAARAGSAASPTRPCLTTWPRSASAHCG